MSKPYAEEPIAEINIIPFVDIILVILIIFMVTVPQMVREGFSVRLPKISSSNKKQTPSSKLTIVISNTGDIFFGGKLISLRRLSFIARKSIENSSSPKVMISADQSVSHGRVMEIVGTLKEVGIQDFVFSTSSE